MLLQVFIMAARGYAADLPPSERILNCFRITRTLYSSKQHGGNWLFDSNTIVFNTYVLLTQFILIAFLTFLLLILCV
jgi:hypothetical protein